MDLVDIDKVLNDLELKEDNKNNKILSDNENIGNNSNINSDEQKHIKNYNDGDNDDNKLTIELDKNKRFVAVSQVLSSLDDYCRNVNQLKLNFNNKESINIDNNDKNNIIINNIPSSSVSSRTTVLNKIESKLTKSFNNFDKNTINLNENDTNNINNDNDEQLSELLSTNSSITTSSPSSFSSGPSPPPPPPPQLLNNDENNIEKINDKEINKDKQDLCIKSNNDDKNILNISSNDNNIDNIKNNHEINDKATAITFGSTMDEISDTELDSMLQEIEIELQQNQQNDDTNVINDPNNIKTSLNDNNDDNESISSIGEITISSSSSILGYNYISIGDSLINSDGDCSKYNSEIINDDNTISSIICQSDIKTVPTTITTTSPNNIIQNSTITTANIDVENFTNDLQSQEQHSLLANKSMNSNDNLQNDNFSQASTIEFNDNENNDNEQEKLNTNNINNDNEKTNKLQRPNSLDLPTINQQYLSSTSQNNDVPNINDINSTAGQTPSELQPQSLSSEHLPSVSCNQQQLSIDNNINIDIDTGNISSSSSITISQLGKIPPFWIPDSETNLCMQCKKKFSLIKRRHHCRACGQVLCSVCCSKKSKLQFLGDNEVKICIQCYLILNKTNDQIQQQQQRISDDSISDDDDNDDDNNDLILSDNNNNKNNNNSINNQNSNNNNNNQIRSPNPNNPMEYCSMISPYQQIEQQQQQQQEQQNNHIQQQNPISVMVPVGVLKREGVLPKNPRKDKNVIFSDGIRPGCDLADLDNNWDDIKFNGTNNNRKNIAGKLPTATGSNIKSSNNSGNNITRNRNKPTTSSSLSVNDENDSFIPKKLNGLPPIHCKNNKNEYEYKEIENNIKLIERLKNEILKFALQKNFFVYVKIVTLKCCINKTIINFTTFGMHHVGQDEIIILLELNNKFNYIPKDIFIHLNEIYYDADKGQPILELGFSMPKQQNFLNSREHGGFLYIRSTFQCLQEIYLPESPFLIGILIHRWEVPWAKIFPLRLMLRLGAQYRYYPSPHVSICERNSVYAEIAQTIINFLADFRNYSYTLTTIKGMYIHMEDRKTNVLIPKNRYDQIIKALNNSSDHILALGGNFSKKADGHLVCIQNMESNCADSHTYSTQAINIQGQPRKVTGASFIVLNGALKTTSGLSGKCSIVEDGLMVQILPQKMQSIRALLKNMKDIDILCGPIDADETQTEIVSIKWTDNDTEFNIGVESPIDGKKMNGIPSIRVHSGFNYFNTNHLIRWTEVFIIQSGEETSVHGKDPIDISKLSEQIARSASMALSSFLDLLAANGYNKIGLRVTLNQENVCFEAGSKNTKLAPLYMNALDNELIPILHKQINLLEIDMPIIAELIFHILDK